MSIVDFSLAGKVALVTGASRGIGKALALALAEAGADVIGISRREGPLQASMAEVAATGRRALAIPADVTKLDDLDRVVEQAMATFGRIDILVNNAGTIRLQYALDVGEDAWDKMMNTNLKGLFFCSQRVGRVMVEQRSGRIINVASQTAFVGEDQYAVYATSKAGVVHLTKLLAVEWARYGINVNAVAPTWVRTAMSAAALADEAFYADVVRRIPLGHVSEPKDVAGAVIYLASPAASFVTGHTLLIDGGWTAW